MVVLPALGLPASAMVKSAIYAPKQSHLDLRGFFLPQGKVIALDEIFHRVAKRRVAFDQNRLTAENAHLGKTAAQGMKPR